MPLAWLMIYLPMAAPTDPLQVTTAALNGYRAKADRPARAEHPSPAAVAHAHGMARFGYFSQIGVDGSTVGDRLRAQGYR